MITAPINVNGFKAHLNDVETTKLVNVEIEGRVRQLELNMDHNEDEELRKLLGIMVNGEVVDIDRNGFSNIPVPIKNSQLENDSNFIKAGEVDLDELGIEPMSNIDILRILKDD